MSRQKTDPSRSLSRFIYGIFDYYLDKGMSRKAAKVRMVSGSTEAVVNLILNDDELPDHLLVTHLQETSQMLKKRGSSITKIVRESFPEEKNTPEESLKALRDLKQLVDATDHFIENYKGWVNHGTKN